MTGRPSQGDFEQGLMVFADRVEAAQDLARALRHLRPEQPIVLSLREAAS